MSEKQLPTVILIRETWLSSLISDAGTFALFAGLIGLGWLLGSSAMQWSGFVVAAFMTFARAGSRADEYRYTIAQARDKLDQLEGKCT